MFILFHFKNLLYIYLLNKITYAVSIWSIDQCKSIVITCIPDVDLARLFFKRDRQFERNLNVGISLIVEIFSWPNILYRLK